MKSTMRTMAVLSALIVGSVAASQAETWNVNVPFAFEAQGIAFPAGHYEVSEVSNHGFLTFRCKQYPEKQFMWIAHPNEMTGKTDAVLTFEKNGSVALLKSIQDPHVQTNAFSRRHATDLANLQVPMTKGSDNKGAR